MQRIVPSQVVEVIDNLFPFAASQQDDQGSRVTLNHTDTIRLAGIVELTDQIPSELLILERERYADFIVSLTAIKTSIQTWQLRGGVALLERIPGSNSNLNPVTILRKSLAKCPDESPDKSSQGLEFIPDEELRNSIRLDISASFRAYSNNEWKAATILGGATIEALLLWSIQNRKSNEPGCIDSAVKTLKEKNVIQGNPGSNIEKWNLHTLIEASLTLNIIKESTASQARLAKDYRNLIHPGRAIKLGQICDRGTALSALASIDHIVRDLSKE